MVYRDERFPTGVVTPTVAEPPGRLRQEAARQGGWQTLDRRNTKGQQGRMSGSEVFAIEGRRVLVERILAQVCECCGEATFARETTESIRRLVHGSRPDKTVPLDVFALA